MVLQVQLPPAPGLPSELPVAGWDVLLLDPFGLVVLGTFAAILLLSAVRSRKAWRHLAKQEGFLDHQRDANERALGQNAAINRMLEEQYAQANTFNQQAFEQSQALVQLHTAALAQLTAISAQLERIAGRLDAPPQP